MGGRFSSHAASLSLLSVSLSVCLCLSASSPLSTGAGVRPCLFFPSALDLSLWCVHTYVLGCGGVAWSSLGRWWVMCVCFFLSKYVRSLFFFVALFRQKVKAWVIIKEEGVSRAGVMRQSLYWRIVDGELEMGMLFAHHGAILGTLFPFVASPHASTATKKTN
ncbi:MAG: hypothetical protein BYD32DRAFT_429085 [Podila humilis]|nr:MAG: hypothetical protein BYD32DRAFT_429085 [Podila humilis]